MEEYQRLEVEFGKWAQVENVVSCSSGTAALHLALEALQLPLGSQVIVPEFTMIACARAVTLAGLTPVFVDCGSDLLIDVDLVDQVLSDGQSVQRYMKTISRTQSFHLALSGYSNVLNLGIRAIMPVHIYGRRCDMEGIHDLACKYDLRVIEDLAEAHGVKPHPKTDAAAWSFYRNKIIAGEEGGVIAFKQKLRADDARKLRSVGFTNKHDFSHIPRGHNYRLANCLASLILRNFETRDGKIVADISIEERWAIVDLYNKYCPDQWRMPYRDAPWVYDIHIPGQLDANKQDTIVKTLVEAGIAARHSFKPMSHQPEYQDKDRSGATERRLPWNAFRASTEVIYLPVQHSRVVDGNVISGTSEEEVKKAFEVINRTLGC